MNPARTWQELSPERRARVLDILRVDGDDWTTTDPSDEEYEGEAVERAEEIRLAIEALVMMGSGQ